MMEYWKDNFLFVALAWLMACSALTAQDSTNVWVKGITAPQYFALRVGDIDAAVDWYKTAFGLEKLDDSQAGDGSWRIVNLQNDFLFVEIVRDNRAEKANRPQGFFKVGFRVPDVETVADRMAGATGERPRIVEFPRHGVYILQLTDPEGNVVQLTSPFNEDPETG